MWIEKWNAIHKQLKGQNSKITAKEWNDIINILKEQANNNTSGILNVKKTVDNIIGVYEPVLNAQQEEMIRAEMQDFIEGLIEQVDGNLVNLDAYLTNIFSQLLDIKSSHIKVSYNEPSDESVIFWGKLSNR